MKIGDISSSNKLFLGLVGIIVIGMSLIYFGKELTMPTQGGLNDSAQTTPAAVSVSKISALEKELEEKLKNNLLQMQGAGKVQVSVSLSTGLRTEFARNENVTKRTATETDQAGGTRETTEITQNNQVVMPGGSSQPVMVMEDRPEVAGVLIIAEGARDAKVRETIHRAVQTLLSIPGNKITVVPMEGAYLDVK